MSKYRTSTIATCLTAVLTIALSPISTFAQSATTFGGEAVGLKANAAGISLALADSGALPSSGGTRSSSLAAINIAGIASAYTLSSSASGSGTTSQAQVALHDLNLLNGLVAATVVNSYATATCSGSTAGTSGNAELAGLSVNGQAVVDSSPNLSISVPGGISVIINQQTSSSGGSSGSITVNAVHVTGPSIDIVIGSAQSSITCS